jgi:hypothetical protein
MKGDGVLLEFQAVTPLLVEMESFEAGEASPPRR